MKPNQSEASHYIRVQEASLDELLSMRGSSFPKEELQNYFDVLLAYLRHDLEKLKIAAHYIDASTFPLLSKLSILRYQIRIRSVCENTIKQVLDLADTQKLWQGEAYFVAAMALTILDKHVRAQELFLTAYNKYAEIGAHRKSIKALLNHLIAESHINPEKKLIVDYHHLAERAKSVGEFGMVGLAYANISREYQLIGANELALEYCNRALEFQRCDIGTVHYYLSVVNRAHILNDLGRIEEARLDVQAASIADFPEIKSAVAALEEIIEPENKADSEDIKDLTPTWEERIDELREGFVKCDRLTKLENRVVDLLSKQEQTKFELMESIYGHCHDFEAMENRLKVLLSRLRKKRPGLIVFEKSRYRISDRIYLIQLQKAVSQ